MQFYIDTSIWIDLYEDRKGFNGEPLGEYAMKLFAASKGKGTLWVSDVVIRELEGYYSRDEIRGLLTPFMKNIKKVGVTKEQAREARRVVEKYQTSQGDALHAILARDNDLILISRDRDFLKLAHITKSYRPEDWF